MKAKKPTIVMGLCLSLIVISAVAIYGQTNGNFDREQFLEMAASDGTKEVMLAMMVQAKVDNKQVKEFAQMLEKDHRNANGKLKQLADRKGWSLPNNMIAKHEEQVDQMEDLFAEELRKKYVIHMVEGHQNVIDKFKEAKNSVQDEDLKNWITETIPVLEKHLKRAKELQESMKQG